MELIEVQYHKAGKNVHQTSDGSAVDALHIAICPPELSPFQRALRKEPTNATYIIQGYIADALKDRGHRLTFVIPRNLHDVVCTNDMDKLEIAPRTWTKSFWVEIAGKIVWRIQRLFRIPYLNLFSNYRHYDSALQCLPGHDIVYERNGIYKYDIAKACKRLGLPYVVYFEADDIFEYDVMGTPLTGLLRWRASMAIRYNLNAASCVICVSEPLKLHLVRNWKVPSEKIVVFPNVADVQRFKPDPVVRADVRASWGLGSRPVIIFVGNFYEWHDVATLLESYSKVLLTNPDAYLILVGDGTQRENMMKRATELGIDHAVRFTGLIAHADIPRMLATADVAVVPYPPMETDLWLSPLKLYEYMASGKAIIATAIGQLNDVIQDGHNGLLVPPGDTQAMATAIQQLINDFELRSRLSQQARMDAVQHHSWDHYISRLERLFTTVIEGKSLESV